MSLTGLPPTCVSGNLCRLSSHSTLVISGASVSRRAVLSSLILVSPGFLSKLSKLQEGRAIVCSGGSVAPVLRPGSPLPALGWVSQVRGTSCAVFSLPAPVPQCHGGATKYHGYPGGSEPLVSQLLAQIPAVGSLSLRLRCTSAGLGHQAPLPVRLCPQKLAHKAEPTSPLPARNIQKR